MNIPVIYEDEWLVVLDKPQGLLTIPSPKNEPRTLTSILNQDLIERNISYRLHPCHRLDRQTSGLIIYAKGKSVQKKMMDLFHQRKIKKTYIAFVQGHIAKAAGEINIPIERKPAQTRYKLIKEKNNFSVLEVEPITGRTNQIRIHFSQIGHPVVGEDKFSFRRDFKLRSKRLCLQAKKLEFKHPVSGKFIQLSLDLPEDMKKLVDKKPAEGSV
ncbi:MAG: RNA pseudouridine synthase [Candidatus Omnitrophica bacterium]|nr:RNA pseudouridine synthase [Candidatus Omnitrophota bacterium]